MLVCYIQFIIQYARYEPKGNHITILRILALNRHLSTAIIQTMGSLSQHNYQKDAWATQRNQPTNCLTTTITPRNEVSKLSCYLPL